VTKYNRKKSIPQETICKGLIKGISLFMALVACLISNVNATEERVADKLNIINTEHLIRRGHLNNDKCYYEDMAYSQGTVILMEVADEAKPFKCSSLNSYELNAKLGWQELSKKKDNEVKSKLTVTRD